MMAEWGRRLLQRGEQDKAEDTLSRRRGSGRHTEQTRADPDTQEMGF